MADLSKERVTRGQRPFSHVGIDVFGPFMVKRGRSRVKRYGCIESWEDLNPVFYIYLLYLTTTLKEQSVPTAAVILKYFCGVSIRATKTGLTILNQCLTVITKHQ